MRVLSRIPFDLSVEVSGTPDGAVSLLVEDYDGNTVHEASTTTNVEGVYTFSVPAITVPDTYEATFSYTISSQPYDVLSSVEVAESRLVSLDRLRAVVDAARAEASLPELDDDEALVRVLTEVEDTFAKALGFPPFLRGERFYVDSLKGGRRLRLPGAPFPRRLISLYVGGDVDTGASVKGGKLLHSLGWPVGLTAELHLVHGIKPGADLQRAALVYAEELARKTDLPRRATEVATEGAIFSLAMPGPNTPTGIPEVDGVLNRYVIRF